MADALLGKDANRGGPHATSVFKPQKTSPIFTSRRRSASERDGIGFAPKRGQERPTAKRKTFVLGVFAQGLDHDVLIFKK